MVKSPLKSTMQILPYMKKAMFRLQGHKQWKFRNSTKVKALFSHKPAHWKHLLNLFSVFCTIRNVWRENQFELFPFQRTRAHCSKKHFFSATLADQHNSAIISELCWCLEQEARLSVNNIDNLRQYFPVFCYKAAPIQRVGLALHTYSRFPTPVWEMEFLQTESQQNDAYLHIDNDISNDRPCNDFGENYWIASKLSGWEELCIRWHKITK